MADHYTQLLEWRRAEGATRGLAKLPTDFYATTQAYLADVRRTFESELRENPSGRKGDLARQTHQRAVQIARDVVEARLTKILSQAFQASVGGGRDLPNAVPVERQLFERLVQVLSEHRAQVTPFLEPAAPPPSTRPATPPAAPAPPSVAEGHERAPPAGSVAFVRILKDGRPLEVGNETIDLSKEDVVSLPSDAARLLVTGKMAEMILPASKRPPP